jgi:hypothetical protein
VEQVFDDWLTMSVRSLNGGGMEELYLQAVAKHTSGKKGRAGLRFHCPDVRRTRRGDGTLQPPEFLGSFFDEDRTAVYPDDKHLPGRGRCAADDRVWPT